MNLKFMRKVNTWRDNFNPLRGLTIQRAVSLLEAGERGEYADLQWTYRFIERRNATVRALKRLRLSAIKKLDWDIKIVAREGIDQGLAEKQQAALREAYDRVDNLTAAIAHLALAEFRGFSMLEKHRAGDGLVTHLEPVPQWHWVRKGLYGAWEFNEKATSTNRGDPVNAADFVVREVEDPIDEIALICFIRMNLSQKDWDGFVETFGIPPIFVTRPADVPPDKENEYQAMAEAVVSDMRGSLPHGSDVKTVDAGSRGQNPFRAHLDFQREEIVLAGTSGKLTMLNGPTGLGSGQSEAHSDVFDTLAQAEAVDINEVFQKQLDAEILRHAFPDQPVLAYFQLAAPDQEDLTALVDRAAKLSQAGLEVDAAEMSEKLGLKLTRAVAAPARMPGAGPLPNRKADPVATGKFLATVRSRLGEAAAEDLKPLRSVLEAVLADPAKASEVAKTLPNVARKLLRSPALASEFEAVLGTAMVEGLAKTQKEGN